MAPEEYGWGVKTVAQLIGVKRRTLALWLKQGTAQASVAPPRGRRQSILLGLEDVLEVSMIAFLRQQKVPMQRVKQILARLREGGKYLSDFDLLMVTGDGEVVGYKNRVSAVALGKHYGQVILLPVAIWRQHAQAAEHEEIPIGATC